MAAVYLAHEIALNRKVAIKVMSPALLTGEGMVRRFRQEAITVANMSHPHIITIHAVRQIEDLHFFVMKFVEGRSLEHIVRSTGPLPIQTVRGLLWMVGNALAYGHRRGVVHRDVKPANILLDEDGNAVVTDFGIAKLVLRENGVPRASRGGETQTGVIVGTPTYMSPEQCLARPVSAASDQYSLGLVAYELLTGRPPFTGSPFVVMHAHTERTAPPIREQRPDCDSEMDEAIQRMLAKDPLHRWPSVQHALAALGAAPLADNDPARAALGQLSIPATFRRSDEVLQPGSTPVPVSGASRADEVRPYVAAIEIFAPPQIVEVGDSFTLSGSPRNPSGDTVPGVRLRWTSSDEQIARVDETRGLVQALAPGEVRISAAASGVHNAVTLNIVPRRVATISVFLPPGALHAGERVQLVATPEDKRHEAVSTAVHWASADESVAIVAQDGVVSAKAPGEVLVWAESQGVRAMARIEVRPAPVATIEPMTPAVLEVGESAELTAATFDQTGAELTSRPIRWSSSDPGVAEIVRDRVVLARTAGLARLTCNSEGKTATSELAVVLPVVAKILIEPPPAHVDLGFPVPLHAEVVSARGVRVDRPLHWRADPPQIASVDGKGVVLPLREGRATITASADGVEASVRLEVNPPPELAMPNGDVSPTQVFELEEARRLLARSDSRNSIAGLTFTPPPAPSETKLEPVADVHNEESASPEPFAASEPNVDPERSVEGDAADDGEPPALAPAGADQAAELVAAGSEPMNLQFAPSSGGRFAFVDRIGRRRASVVGAGVLLVLIIIGWRLTASSGSTDSTQLATASGTLADSTAANDSTPIAGPVDTAAQTSSATAADSAQHPAFTLAIGSVRPIRVGDSTTLRGRFVGDNKPDASSITWTSSAPRIARVDARSGRVVAVKEGNATITGEGAGVRARVVVRVIPATPVTLAGRLAVARLVTSDPPPPLHLGDTTRITVAPLDANGGSLLDRKVTWQSSTPAVATVDNFGLVTAHGIGTTEIVATSEQQAARIPVKVVSRIVTYADGASALRAGAERFLGAIADRDARQLSAALFVDSPDDQKALDWLLEKLRTPEANLRVTRLQNNGRATVRDTDASQEVTLTFSWTTPNGQTKETRAKFRSHSTKSGEAWPVATLKALDKLQ
jgi:serine/threonine protein kinase